jgi:tetratricopeptide (TPR) repeat protein
MIEGNRLDFTSCHPLRLIVHYSLGFLLAAALFSEPMAMAAVSQRSVSHTAPGQQEALELQAGATFERELAGGEIHAYTITLNAGQYLHVVVEQRGIDVVVTVFGPDGQQLTEVDSPNGTQGPEPVSVVAEASGTYRLQVRGAEESTRPGRYEVKMEEPREATPQDKNWMAAVKATTEGKKLQEQRTAESLRKAIEKWDQAAILWQAAGEPRWQAQGLAAIGIIYDNLGERHQALSYYHRALALYQDVNDRRGQATCLHNIGVVYNSLGEPQKALEYYRQALPVFQAEGDRKGEALVVSGIGRIHQVLG